MSNIRELSFDEIAQVSGGGNAGDHDRNFDRPTSSTSKNGSIYNGVDSCGAGILVG